MAVSMSFILAWLTLNSGSLWTAALLHASHNLFVQPIFDNLMRDTGRTRWYTTEFGAALALTSAVFAVYFWTRRAEVQQAAPLLGVARAKAAQCGFEKGDTRAVEIRGTVAYRAARRRWAALGQCQTLPEL
jgi:hypothetical protein